MKEDHVVDLARDPNVTGRLVTSTTFIERHCVKPQVELRALMATAGRLVWRDALRRARPSSDRS
jgi:hypothetical protein